jgi:hypothetical protein
VAEDLLIEAEAFQSYGGWVLDPQFLDVMGSPYLLAHGLGRAVDDAETTIDIKQAGRYRVWVRTKDWVPSHHPGRFRLLVNNQPLATTFGCEGRGWIWQDGGLVRLPSGTTRITLRDLTGFDARCDAVFFTSDLESRPPSNANNPMSRWRRALLRIPETPPSAGDFDVVVVGGGIPGCAAALAAARLGLQVALIQNRPVLGGNASPEIGITPRGELRSIVREVAGADRERVIRAEPRIKLYLGWHAMRAAKQENRITSVDAQDTRTGGELRFHAPVFIDCSGVAAVGALAGAEYRLGREARSEFGESLAPEQADSMHHGNTVVFATEVADQPASFPEVPWARKVAGDYAELGGQVVGGQDNIGGLTHFWEYGQWLDPFADAERIRDHLLCAVYGTFANVKAKYPGGAANLRLKWVGYVPAGGESRRLIGDYILTENDIRSQMPFDDAVATCSGHICLHYPGEKYDFRLGDWKFVPVGTYFIPYRCLYSKNVSNLLMAGKHISVSHIAGASTKTMLNGGQMGVATAAAAYLCQKHRTTPRDVHRNHLAELQSIVAEQGEYKNVFRRH